VLDQSTAACKIPFLPPAAVSAQHANARMYVCPACCLQEASSSNGNSSRACSSPARSRKPTPTVPQEFKLSQPCPKPLPQPEPVPPAVKPKPPPKFQPGPTKEQLAIEAAKAAHRQAAAARQADPRQVAAAQVTRRCHSDERRALQVSWRRCSCKSLQDSSAHMQLSCADGNIAKAPWVKGCIELSAAAAGALFLFAAVHCARCAHPQLPLSCVANGATHCCQVPAVQAACVRASDAS
jgi:hypothetical protein